MFDFQKFCQDFRIDTAPRGHQHHRKGWINIECRFCGGTKGFHLGYNQQKDFFTCYRCGWYSTEKVIQTLLKSTDNQLVKSLIRQYQTREIHHQQKEQIIHPDNITLPEVTELQEHHKQYLRKRNFDPEKLITQYQLKATTQTGKYKFRILAPIIFHNQIVSYQCRDYTERQIARYMTCEKEDEVIFHKHILYGWDQVPYTCSSCIVVEGITGVWRLGPGSVCTFGANYDLSQVRLLANRFENIYTLFDPDDAGEKAGKMVSELQALGRNAYQLEITKKGFDSGNISQEIADELMNFYIIK